MLKVLKFMLFCGCCLSMFVPFFSNCENFDLCENCETLDGSHDPDHVFLKIRRPIPVIIRKKNGHVVPLLKANLYALRDEKYAV